MPENTVWLHITLGILLFLGVCCFIAVFAESVRQMLSGFFTIFYRPLSMIQERTWTYIQNVRTWILSQLEDESEREGEGPLYYIIGSVLYTILTVLFILCDFGMIVLTAEAMGLDKSYVQLPLDTSTLTAATLVTTSLFLGGYLFRSRRCHKTCPVEKVTFRNKPPNSYGNFGFHVHTLCFCRGSHGLLARKHDDSVYT